MPAKLHHLKTIARYIAFVICLLTCSFAAHSQTTLAAGDIAFVGYITTDDNVNGTSQNDEFSFVLLRDITAGITVLLKPLDQRGLARTTGTYNTNQRAITWRVHSL